MGIEATAATSEIWADLYSVFKALWDDPRMPARRVYFDRVQGDNFVRPSVQIKFITFRGKSNNFINKSVEQDIMVKYFASTEFEAIAAAEVIMDILTGWPQKSLPKYDFAQSPPAPISITGRDQYGRRVPRTMGIRVDPDSFKADPFKTEDDNWEVPITFSMTSPRHRDLPGTIITSITYQLLTQLVSVPLDLEAFTQAIPSVEQL